MPYPHLPQSYEGPAWITCPNRYYDPREGVKLYNRYLDELIYAEELGFDGICVNEHHANAYGNMPAPNLMAMALARQTRRVQIGVIGNALPLYNPPQRVAEEFAMIDVVSGGRLIAGFVVGGGPEYYSNGMNPAEARERFYEAHDLIVRAWTEPGPFEFHGKHYRQRYVNPWPLPLQKPHPPIWIPGAGSVETMEFVARRRYAYMGIPYFHKDVFRKNLDIFRECCEREGYTARPEQMSVNLVIYVSESDARARQEFEPHYWYFAKRLLPGINVNPPGYTSVRSMMKMVSAFDEFALAKSEWKDVEEGMYAVVGSAATVRDRLIDAVKFMGNPGNMLCLMQMGTLPAELTRKSMDLFASEVMPALRREFAS
jgi:alkanesulfonate monooxygenase SsuD/methylene tetrahydromethanopterin reductase-like flavin-dependent oxidoreductase (luciferase family)